MTVYLKFFAGLRDALPAGQRPYPAQMDEGATVRLVLGVFGVPPDKPAILLVNGRHAALDHVLVDGDLLAVFPPVAGG
ncbi:MAG: MoaD/ThiS family protein [Deferrisomatales bacterium]|nr:MoaD/ThiS family protein [Deferrisomatales bacterium]